MKLLCPGHTQQLLAPSNCLGKKTAVRMQHAHPDCLPSVLGKHFSFDDEEVPNSYRLRTFLFWKLSEKKHVFFPQFVPVEIPYLSTTGLTGRLPSPETIFCVQKMKYGMGLVSGSRDLHRQIGMAKKMK